MEDLRRLPYNSFAPHPPAWKEQKTHGKLTHKSYSHVSICLCNGKTFHILPTNFSDKSSFPVHHLRYVIFYDMWVSHIPPLHSSFSSFFLPYAAEVYSSLHPSRTSFPVYVSGMWQCFPLLCFGRNISFWRGFHLWHFYVPGSSTFQFFQDSVFLLWMLFLTFICQLHATLLLQVLSVNTHCCILNFVFRQWTQIWLYVFEWGC